MASNLLRLTAKNFKILADVELETHPINILFGPNGAGKSTLLGTLWFMRDCLKRSVETAVSSRNQGLGLFYDGAEAGDVLRVGIETALAHYELAFGLTAGRIEPLIGETLKAKDLAAPLIERSIGSPKARFYSKSLKQSVDITLPNPDNLALSSYLAFESEANIATVETERIIKFLDYHTARSLDLYRLRQFGSETSHHTTLLERAENLWSVLRNLHDRRSRDARYETILQFMREANPNFHELVFEQTGPSAVYCSFLEKDRRNPVLAANVSDGHLHLLILLTALFSVGADKASVILLDEPEISLHPHAIAVLAKAITLAAQEWQKQIFLATHSPVLISQFEPTDILVAGRAEGRTTLTRLSEMTDIQDLLEHYAVGSLYMAELVAAQSVG